MPPSDAGGSAPRGRLLVIGAGWLGGAVATRLARGGGDVVATTRSGAWRSDVPALPRLSVRRLDLVADGDEAVAAAFRGVRRAVACIAPGRGQDRRALYVGGARRFADACVAASVERAVWCSSTSALPALDAVLDESCAAWPVDERGRVQREAEEEFRQRCAAGGVTWVILRLAGLYGPGRELERVYAGSLAGEAGRPGAPLPGDGREPTNLVHRDDAVAAVAAALALPGDVAALVHVCDRDHTTRRELVERLAAARGVAAPAWERPAAPPCGKRVASPLLERLLGVVLAHPRHTP